MDIDVSFATEFEDIINTAGRNLSNSYDSSWSDSVHESFGSFLSSYKIESDGVTFIVNSFERTCKTLTDVDGSRLLGDVSGLIGKI